MIETKFKNTEIGLIPEDWEVNKVDSACSIKARIGWQGLTTSEYLSQGNYILITGTDFKNGFIDWDNCNFVSEWRYNQDVNIQIKNGDTLITKDGTIGKVAFVNECPMPATLNSGVFVIRPKDNNIDNYYLAFVFKSFWFCDFIDKITAGSTIVHLYQKDFVNFLIPLPPLPEQRRIAEVLSQADELIKQWENVIAKKRDIKTATMQLLLTGKKRLNGFDKPWVEKKLGEFCNYIKNGAGYDANNVKGYPMCRIETMTKGFINYNLVGYSTEEPVKYKMQYGDILFTHINSIPYIGKVAFYYAEQPLYHGMNVLLLRTSDENIDKKFLFLLLSSYRYKKCFETIAKPAINQASISTKELAEVELYLPSDLFEQRAIAEILSDMDEEIKTLEAKVEKLRNIKSGMMQQLLSGKIRLTGDEADNVRQFVENNFGQMPYATEDEAEFGL